MRSELFSGLAPPLVVLSALCVSAPALGAEHSSPLSRAPKRVYPNGTKIRQAYVKPEANQAALADAAAAAGHVSSAAAMSNLMAMPSARNRAQGQLTYILKTQTRIPLGQANGPPTPPAAAAAAAAPPPSLYKFSYGLQYKDVPLWKYSSQSQLIQVKGNARKTLYLRERNLPDPAQLGASEATVKSDDAAKLGLDDSKADAAPGAPLAVDAQNEPPHREIHVDAGGKPTLSWAYVVRSTDRARPFARRYWVAARDDARILAKEDLVYHGEPYAPQQGRVTGAIFGFRKSPLDPPDKDQGLNDDFVTLSGNPVVTDAGGFYTLPASAPLNLQLHGPYCRVINDSGSPLTATKSGNNLSYPAEAEQDLAQVSAFKWVSTAHAFVKDYLPSNPARLAELPTHVNISDTCNAFFDPNEHTLNFFKSGDGCVNTAFCDVACHEFGHAVDDQLGDILDGGYSEGFGDALAILITRDSIIGRDFLGKNQPLRNAKDIVTWPPQDDEVHEMGRIYAGFAWELTQQLLSKLGTEDKAFEAARQLILGAAALNPKDIPDAVRLSFLVDRQNGSPLFNELAAAADSRKIPRPDSPGAIDNPNFLAAGPAK